MRTTRQLGATATTTNSTVIHLAMEAMRFALHGFEVIRNHHKRLPGGRVKPILLEFALTILSSLGGLISMTKTKTWLLLGRSTTFKLQSFVPNPGGTQSLKGGEKQRGHASQNLQPTARRLVVKERSWSENESGAHTNGTKLNIDDLLAPFAESSPISHTETTRCQFECRVDERRSGQKIKGSAKESIQEPRRSAALRLRTTLRSGFTWTSRAKPVLGLSYQSSTWLGATGFAKDSIVLIYSSQTPPKTLVSRHCASWMISTPYYVTRARKRATDFPSFPRVRAHTIPPVTGDHDARDSKH
ncbi:hypothetical protein AB1N83_012891 [Pleurotus pulmonarius]